jgi:hypothetical protein
MADAQKRLGAHPEIDLVSWSESWLKTAGCSVISLDIQNDESGNVVRFDVKQEIYN